MSEETTKTEAKETKTFYETHIVAQQAETSDGEVVGLLFEDGGSTNIPKWEAELLLTDHPVDPNDARNTRANYIAKRVLEELLDMNVKVGELKFYVDKVLDSMFDPYMGSVNAMVNYLITKESNGLVTNQKEIRMQHVDNILSTLAPKKRESTADNAE